MAIEGNSKMDTEKPFPAVEMALRWIDGGEYSSLWEYNKLQSLSWAPLFEGRLALRRGKILVRVSFSIVFSDKFLSFF